MLSLFDSGTGFVLFYFKMATLELCWVFSVNIKMAKMRMNSMYNKKDL